MKRALPFLLIALTTIAHADLDISGKWKGRIVIPKEIVDKVQKLKDEKQKGLIEGFLQGSQQVKIAMTLNKDKTFSVTITNGGKSTTAAGTWRMKGFELFTKTTTREGKAVPASEVAEKVAKIDKNGKAILRILGPKEAPVPVGMLFER